MLYTVLPLEQIYRDSKKNGRTRTTNKASQEEETEYKDVVLQHGRIVTRKEGDRYVIEHINSTNMQDYLNSQYAPGNDYKDEM